MASAKPRREAWSADEDRELGAAARAAPRYNKSGRIRWSAVACRLPGRSSGGCRSRYHIGNVDTRLAAKPRRAAWSADEDRELGAAAREAPRFDGSGKIRWSAVACRLPGRSSGACRSRYHIVFGNFDTRPAVLADVLIITRLRKAGMGWAALAPSVPALSGHIRSPEWCKNSMFISGRRLAREAARRAKGPVQPCGAAWGRQPAPGQCAGCGGLLHVV